MILLPFCKYMYILIHKLQDVKVGSSDAHKTTHDVAQYVAGVKLALSTREYALHKLTPNATTNRANKHAQSMLINTPRCRCVHDETIMATKTYIRHQLAQLHSWRRYHFSEQPRLDAEDQQMSQFIMI